MKRPLLVVFILVFAVSACGGSSGGTSGKSSSGDSGKTLAQQACAIYKTARDQYQADLRAFFATSSTDSAAALKIDDAFAGKVASAAEVAARAAAKENTWDALNQVLHRATKADTSIISAECAKAG